MKSTATETIAAIATPPGRGGVGIIRISGSKAFAIAQTLTEKKNELPLRHAIYASFKDSHKNVIDQGIVLAFKAPHSFTGEDVVELQGHGGPVVLDLLLKEILSHGARHARPGEFSERAFLNDKIDLAQAEAIADLIDAGSAEAARSALRSLTGVFSEKVNILVDSLIHLRIYVEAAIDFPDEEVDFLSDGHVENQLLGIKENLQAVQQEARQGALLRDGMQVVIAGKPNAGKSSLLNALAGFDAAIVTDIAGTTRDVLRERIQIDGMPLHIIDTAGLRETTDVVEKEGVRRALKEVEKADTIIFVFDASVEKNPQATAKQFFSPLPSSEKLIFVANKSDLLQEDKSDVFANNEYITVALSAKTGLGLLDLKEKLKTAMGFQGQESGLFTARRRHLDALEKAEASLELAHQQLIHRAAGELVAEDLRAAQNALSEITGTFTPDDLLGRIFSSFCIGK